VSQGTNVTCGYCGAPGALPAGAIVSVCRFCGRETPVLAGPSAALGAPVAIGDFRGPATVGFLFDRREPPPDGERLEYVGGRPPQLRITMAVRPTGTAVLWLGGSFDDLDMSATYRFAPSASADASLAFRFRFDAKGEGGYSAVAWSDGAWGLNAREGAGWSVISSGRATQGFRPPGEWNHLRVVAKGERLRVFLGGMLLASMSDGRFRQGRFSLRTQSGDRPLELWLASLEVREAL
jgi:hypothetical protein